MGAGLPPARATAKLTDSAVQRGANWAGSGNLLVAPGSPCDERPWVNLLDRHIFKSVLFTCLAAVGLFSFVVALPNVIKDLLGPLLAEQISMATFLRLVALILPFAISYALPMGILTGVLLTVGRLSADSEVTAMRAAGVSVFRIARPVFILGALGAVGALYVNFQSMPWARVQYHKEFGSAVRQNPLSFIVPKTFIRDFRGARSGMVIYVGDKPGGAEGRLLKDIWIWQLDEQQRVTRFIRAESGRLDYDAATNSLIPRLQNARTEERDSDNPEDFSKSPIAPAVQLAGDDMPRFPLNEYLGRNQERTKQEWLTYAQLREEEAKLAAQPPPPPEKAEEAARTRMKLALVIHEKFNLSLAVLSFALVAVPLGIKVSRRETSANLGLALLLVLGFYMLTVMVKWLDRHPEYRPDLLLWLPNVIFLMLAVKLFRRIESA
jgi:lipopolysaccharide export system permease protein